MPKPSSRPRRSVLVVSASDTAALAALPSLTCDVAILDLQAVPPQEKTAAREAVKALVAGRAAGGCEIVIRINPVAGEWGADDLAAAIACEPDGILLPAIATPRDVLEAGDVLDEADAPDSLRLWAMIETPRALANIGAIAELGRDPAARLACLVAGGGGLLRGAGKAATPARRYLAAWLMQIVLAARAGGLDALDSTGDAAGDLAEAAAMGFDGAVFADPAVIGPANQTFEPASLNDKDV